LTSQLIMSISGKGEAFLDSEPALPIEYQIRVYQKYDEDQVRQTKTIKGFIAPLRGIPIGKVFRLVTEEGYSLKCFVQDPEGSIMPSGMLLDRSGESLL
jgi:hypothetical protein